MSGDSETRADEGTTLTVRLPTIALGDLRWNSRNGLRQLALRAAWRCRCEKAPFHSVAFGGYNITMTDTPYLNGSAYPSAQQVVNAHRPVLRRIVEALRKGTRHARWYADYMDEDIDRALAPALVRKGARRELIATGTAVANEEDDAPETMDGAPVPATPPNGQAEFLSNLGLAVSADGIRFRVLRSDDGTVPVPGPSKARQAFYSQQAYFPGWAALVGEAVGSVPTIPSAITNCVLHWETDDEYNLTRIYLALPLGGTTTRDSVELLWNEIIWRRPTLGIVNLTPPDVDGGTQVEAEIIDQDIYIGHEGTGTTE